jgi:hypothetical protein
MCVAVDTVLLGKKACRQIKCALSNQMAVPAGNWVNDQAVYPDYAELRQVVPAGIDAGCRLLDFVTSHNFQAGQRAGALPSQ